MTDNTNGNGNGNDEFPKELIESPVDPGCPLVIVSVSLITFIGADGGMEHIGSTSKFTLLHPMIYSEDVGKGPDGKANIININMVRPFTIMEIPDYIYVDCNFIYYMKSDFVKNAMIARQYKAVIESFMLQDSGLVQPSISDIVGVNRSKS